jgi:exonuclease SbcC
VILSTLQIHSFGALSSLSLELKPGMNVILGPNEAGKSTLFRALQHLLLTPVNLSKRSFQERMRMLLPLGGADTVSCALDFRVGTGRYRLEKSWGAKAEAELVLPGGSRLGEAEAVESKLLEILPVHPGTLRTVLMTRQSGLATTLEELQADKETVYGLSDLLHHSVLETDGISVQRFQELLERRYQEYLRHWDLERQLPERKRSGGTRWSRERGTVLEAYYAQEDAESHYQEVKEKEASYGAITEQLENCIRELAGKEENRKRIEPAAKDAEKRTLLEARLRETEISLKETQAHFESWTKGAVRRQSLEREIPELEEALQALEQEKARVQTFLAKKDLVERFRRIQAKRERLQQAEAELRSLPPLPRRQLDQLRESAAEIDRLRTALQAGNLSLTFQAREAVEVTIQKDVEEASDHHLSAGKSLTVEAGGKIEVRHPNWSLEVYSGHGEFKKAAKQYKQAQSAHAQHLKEAKVGSLEEAVEASRRYEEQRSEAQTAKAVYQQELGNDTFEALEEACGENPSSPPPREQSQVLEELAGKRNRLQNLKAELEEVRRCLEDLGKRYRDKETLFARIAELGADQREISEKTAGLASLPEGFSETQSLLEHYNELTEEVQSLTRQRIRLESDCRNAEDSLPDESSEEAAQQMEDARQHFNRQLRKAEVLVRIQQATAQLLGQLDRGIYEPFVALISRYLAALSDDRYRDVPTGAAIPGGVFRADGQALPYQLLSAGTKDLFALALRLAMADFFLRESEGFLLLDDPLVDLDPVRQKRAAAILAEFAGRQQLVFFTCQPTHAELFEEAHRIELDKS